MEHCHERTQTCSETLPLHTAPWDSLDCPHIGNGRGSHWQTPARREIVGQCHADSSLCHPKHVSNVLLRVPQAAQGNRVLHQLPSYVWGYGVTKGVSTVWVTDWLDLKLDTMAFYKPNTENRSISSQTCQTRPGVFAMLQLAQTDLADLYSVSIVIIWRKTIHSENNCRYKIYSKLLVGSVSLISAFSWNDVYSKNDTNHAFSYFHNNLKSDVRSSISYKKRLKNTWY